MSTTINAHMAVTAAAAGAISFGITSWSASTRALAPQYALASAIVMLAMKVVPKKDSFDTIWYGFVTGSAICYFTALDGFALTRATTLGIIFSETIANTLGFPSRSQPQSA